MLSRKSAQQVCYDDMRKTNAPRFRLPQGAISLLLHQFESPYHHLEHDV